MRKFKKFAALTVILIMLINISSMNVFADLQSDAAARVQIYINNRVDLSYGLEGSGLSESDIMANKYVYENFDNWSTDRATMVGHTYSGYSSWVDRAKEKIGGLLPSVGSNFAMPFDGFGEYGTMLSGASSSTGNAVPGVIGGIPATIGWFGTTEDGYYGFKMDEPRNFLNNYPRQFHGSTSDAGNRPYYGTADSLLYVGDNNNDGEANIGDWLEFEGTIVLSYDWLVASGLEKEVHLLNNFADYLPAAQTIYRQLLQAGISGLPRVYYNNATSRVELQHHAGKEVKASNNVNGASQKVLAWSMCNDTDFYSVKPLTGISKGDWVNITVALTVSGTDSSDRVITQREYINGQLVTDDNGEGVCIIRPYEMEYQTSTSSATGKTAVESAALESFPTDAPFNAGDAPDKYLGLGVSITAGGTGDDSWGGIDNLCYRIYNDTDFERLTFTTADLSADGKLTVPVVTDIGLTSAQTAVAPSAAIKGIIDLGENATVTAKKININDDPLALVGETVNASIDNGADDLDMSVYEYQGLITGKKYRDNSTLRISGLENTITSDEAYAVSVSTTDATGADFARDILITDNTGDGFISSKFYDYIDNELSSSVTRSASKAYTIPGNTHKIVLKSTDTSNGNMTIEQGGTLVATAVFSGGEYTFTFSVPLTDGLPYTLKKGGSEIATMTPAGGSVVYEAHIVAGKPKLKYTNATAQNVTGFMVATNGGLDTEAEFVTLTAQRFEDMAMPLSNPSKTYTEVMFFPTLKEGEGEATLNSLKEVVAAFEGSSTTVKGNLDTAGKEVVLLVLSDDEWANDSAVANAVVYCKKTTTITAPPATIDGVPVAKTGDYTFAVDFETVLPTGKYTFMVYSGNDAFKRVAAYGKAADNAAAITTLNASAATALSSEATRDALEFYYSDIENLYTAPESTAFYSKVATLMAAELATSPLPVEAAAAKAEAIELYRQCAVITAISDAKLISFNSVESDVEIFGTEPFKSYWENDSNVLEGKKATWKSDIATRISGSTYTSIDGFEKALTEALILQIVEDAASGEAAENVLKESFNGVNTIETASVTERAVNTVVGTDYATITDLKTAITNANTSAGQPDDGGGSLGGTGGGGGGGVGKIEIADDKTEIYTPSENVTTQNSNLAFSDMKSAEWANDAVKALKEKGIINGKTATEFDPNGDVTREEFVKMVIMLAEINVEHGENMKFGDVSKDDWFYTYVKAAVQKYIINGVSETSFGTGQKITRQDMATIVNNVLVYRNIALKEGEISFSDKDCISDYAVIAVSKLAANGIINGYEDGTFRPEGKASRAEAAKMLYGLLQYFK